MSAKSSSGLDGHAAVSRIQARRSGSALCAAEEEHRIRKTPHTHTADVLVFPQKAQGLLCCESHRSIHLGSKFGAKARPPFFVPKSCSVTKDALTGRIYLRSPFLFQKAQTALACRG